MQPSNFKTLVAEEPSTNAPLAVQAPEVARLKSRWLPIGIIGGMFFIFGFVTWLNGPLISFVKLAFAVRDFEAFLVPMAFYISYFVMSLPAAFLLNRVGLKAGMALALVVMALGSLIFGHFATARLLPEALLGLFTIGGGLALLQTASNPYIAILGPMDSAARRIAFMGICNKAAGILAPLVLGQLVLAGMGNLNEQVLHASSAAAREQLLSAFAARIDRPYQAMGVILAVLGVAVYFSPLPSLRYEESAPGNADLRRFEEPAALIRIGLGFLAIFFCIGTEVMAGDAIGTYGLAFGLPLDEAKFFTSFTLLAMLVGYLAGLVLIPRFFSQSQLLRYSGLLGVAGTVAAYLTTGYASVMCVALLGLANAMMWPTIFPLSIRGFGEKTGWVSAILVMGIVGGAIIPQLFAWLKETYHFQLVFVALMLPSYLYIVAYAKLTERTA